MFRRLERAFTGPVDMAPAFWIPLSPAHGIWTYHGPFTAGSTARVSVIAQLEPDVAPAQARAELSAIATTLAPMPGTGRPTTGVALSPADNRGAAGTIVAVVMTAIGLVLFLACANVANLLLAGAAAREREIGVRLALGAGRGRIIRQLLTESVLIATAGGALGVLATVWLLPVVAALAQGPETMDVAPDIRVMGFAAFVTGLAGIGAGLAPARFGTRGRLLKALAGDNSQAGERPRGRFVRSGLVGAQAAASILLLVLTALLAKAVFHVHTTDLGLDVERLASVSPGIGLARYDAPRVAQYWDAALERVRALPVVESAALAEHVPLGDSHRPARWRHEGVDIVAHENLVTAEYFETVGIDVIRGRRFSPDEVRGGEPVAVISVRLAREVFGAVDPVGRILASSANQTAEVRIVGVVEDAMHNLMDGTPPPALYRPLGAAESRLARLIVRARGDLSPSILPVREAVRGVDPDVAVSVWPVDASLSRQRGQATALAGLAALAGGLALALAIVGIFGVTSFVVTQRLREIGVRVAIGATRRDVVRLLLRDALRPVVIGLALGLLGALAGGQVIAGALYGVSPRDPIALVGAGAVLLLAAMLAVLGPARRASRVDPVAMLRQG